MQILFGAIGFSIVAVAIIIWVICITLGALAAIETEDKLEKLINVLKKEKGGTK